MAISATQIRRGMVILFEGQPCKVMEFRHHTPGNLRAMVQTKLAPGESTDGAVFFPSDGKPLGPGYLVVRTNTDVFHFGTN